MPFAFEKLIVYQKAVDFADRVLDVTEGFPHGYGFLADQLNRASVSIAANLAERQRSASTGCLRVFPRDCSRLHSVCVSSRTASGVARGR
ncbi:MAG: four helix bundle protein [Phycisphaerae bacterium]